MDLATSQGPRKMMMAHVSSIKTNSSTFLQTCYLSLQGLSLHVHISFLIFHLVKLLQDGFSHLCLFGNLMTHLVHFLLSHLAGGGGGEE